jgi:sterol 3beta-glucosyltransferase
MHITILAYGSRGDVQPYVALGLELRRAGHEVRLAAPGPFEAFVANHGLEFAPLPGDPPQLARELVKAGWNGPRIARAIAEYILPLVVQAQADVSRACRGADAIIHSFLMTMSGHEAALELDVPEISALIFPVFTRTAAFPNMMFPELPLGGIYNRLTHDFFTRSFWQGGRLVYGWVRRKHPHLPPLSMWPFSASEGQQPPVLYGFSPHVIPRPDDWGDNVHVTGYWFLDVAPGWQAPDELLDFLEAGPPPVYVGFGSMIADEMRKLTGIALDALAQTGQRGLLLAGWGGLGGEDLPGHVFKIDFAPFDWLFPRMAAIVHHGGAGTTAAALRAGVPAIVVPFTSDQPFWGRRVYRLGVGPKPIPRKKLTAAKLAAAIRSATGDQAMRRRAVELGRRIRAEDGVARAVEVVERYLATTGRQEGRLLPPVPESAGMAAKARG